MTEIQLQHKREKRAAKRRYKRMLKAMAYRKPMRKKAKNRNVITIVPAPAAAPVPMSKPSLLKRAANFIFRRNSK